MDAAIEQLLRGVVDAAASARGLLVPVSGGTDSALGYWLCMQAWPEKTLAIHAGTPETLRCREWYASRGPVEFVDTPGVHAEREEMRWARFLAKSIPRGQWLVGCRNRTEDTLGTYSLASRLATYFPLVGTWKSEVMRLAAMIGVPREILDSSARADPDCGRPADLAEIPFEAIDGFLQGRARDLTDAQRAYLQGVLNRNDFKRGLPIRGPTT